MTAVGSGLQYTFLYASKLLCFSVAFCIYCVHLLYVNDRQPCEISNTDGVVVITCYVVLMHEIELKQVIAPGAARRYASADGSSTRGGSTSVRGRVRSPHMAKLHRRQRRRGCMGRDPQYLTCRGRPVLTTPNILTSVLFFPFSGTSEYRKSLSFSSAMRPV